MFFSKANAEDLAKDVYGFEFTKLHSEEKLPLADYKGKVILVVNTASKCGFTPQYEGLEKLYEKKKGDGLVIVGVPSDNFGGQEFDKADEIEKFCKVNYGVTFPMANKEDVKGDKAAPFFVYAKKKLGGMSAPKWNFFKYLIDRNGNLVDYYASVTTPESDKLVKKIDQLLAEKVK